MMTSDFFTLTGASIAVAALMRFVMKTRPHVRTTPWIVLISEAIVWTSTMLSGTFHWHRLPLILFEGLLVAAASEGSLSRHDENPQEEHPSSTHPPHDAHKKPS